MCENPPAIYIDSCHTGGCCKKVEDSLEGVSAECARRGINYHVVPSNVGGERVELHARGGLVFHGLSSILWAINSGVVG